MRSIHLVLSDWPSEDAFGPNSGSHSSALETLKARGRVGTPDETSFPAWLCRLFGVERQQDWPLAPLTYALDGGSPGGRYWLRADPVHLQMRRDRLVLADSRLFPLNETEADELLASVNAHFGDEGPVLEKRHPARWYIGLERAPDLKTHSVHEVCGRAVENFLPGGADGRRWQGYMNGAQMVLHDHAANRAREARGEPVVNSIWFWGGGCMPEVAGRDYAALWSDNEIACALGQAAGLVHQRLPDDGVKILSTLGDGETLVVIDDPYPDAAALQQRWFAPLLVALRRGAVNRLRLTALGPTGFDLAVNRSDLWKFWRRNPKSMP
jgi:hypothetical protein